MAVTLSDADVQTLGPSARAQLARHNAPSNVPKTKKPAASGTSDEALNKTKPKGSGGASEGTRKAAGFTRQAYKTAGGGRAGFTTIRGIIWVFVWLGVLFYLVAHPKTLPTLVHLVFAPVNGVIAVANGAAKVAPKTT